MRSRSTVLFFNGVFEKLLLVSIGASWWGPKVFTFVSLLLIILLFVTTMMILRMSGESNVS